MVSELWLPPRLHGLGTHKCCAKLSLALGLDSATAVQDVWWRQDVVDLVVNAQSPAAECMRGDTASCEAL